MKYSNKLASTSASTVDDPVKTLKEFIPEGELRFNVNYCIRYSDLPINLDIIEDETKFQALVEEDATSFKPLGTLIHSYTRHLGTGKGKGKEATEISADSEDSVVFETYHVSRFGSVATLL